MKDMHSIEITVNGRVHKVEVESRRTLADVLRHDLGYTGTHLGCEHGICGACTILLDGLPARSCLLFGVQADGCEVETVEGLESNGQLNPLQEAFSAHHGLQCGFCTPGFLMLATGFLRENLDPTEEEVREAVSSNLCRCTGYQGIIEAVLDAAGKLDRAKTAAADEAVESETSGNQAEGLSVEDVSFSGAGEANQ